MDVNDAKQGDADGTLEIEEGAAILLQLEKLVGDVTGRCRYACSRSHPRSCLRCGWQGDADATPEVNGDVRRG